MRLARGHAGRERQNRLRAIQRLDLALFVYAQHDRAIGRIQVQAHDVPHFLDELELGESFPDICHCFISTSSIARCPTAVSMECFC